MRSRTSSARWTGSLKEGTGTLSSPSGALKDIRYDFSSRFEDGVNTNPEELIAAAHAGCFSMHLSGQIEKAGGTINSIDTTATVTIEKEIVDSKLQTRVSASGINKDKFQELAKFSSENCPVSKVLKCKITLDAQFEEPVGQATS
jgi:lipoyl-dependent peroxiredoxin